MNEHTPGPWEVVGQGVYSFERPTTQIVRGVRPQGAERTQEGWANAKLIAAAPDLLAALEDALPYLEDAASAWDADGPNAADHALDVARYALKKAGL